MPAARFLDIASANPLRAVVQDLSKGVVSFVERMPVGLERPSEKSLAPERLAIGTHAVYQWCPDGILKSAVPTSFWKQFDSIVTSRNLRTVELIAGSLG